MLLVIVGKSYVECVIPDAPKPCRQLEGTNTTSIQRNTT